MRPRASSLRAGVLAVCALAVAGCTADDEAPPAPAATAVSPLDAVLGVDDDAAVADARNARNREVEEAVADCMAEQGFEYVPSTEDTSMVIEGEAVDTTTRKWAEDNGYGISITPDGQAHVSTFTDPNHATVAALTPAAQEAYYAALLGDLASFDGADLAATPPVLDDMGCTGRAQQEVYGVAGDEQAPGSVEMDFLEMVAEFKDGLPDDAALAEVSARWAACMDDAGSSGYATPQAARDEFQQRAGQLEMDPENGLPAEGPELEALQEEERATAIADVDCQKETGFEAAFRAMRFEREQEFIDAHGADIQAYLAAREALVQ